MADSLYLSPERSGVRWLLDPSAPELAGVARAVQARTEDTQCEPQAVAADFSGQPRADPGFRGSSEVVAIGGNTPCPRVARRS